MSSPGSSTAERMGVGFGRVLRGAGLKVPASATINFVGALGQVGVDAESSVYWAGRATLVQNPEDIAVFDSAFDAFWKSRRVGSFIIEGPPPTVELGLDIADDDDDGEGDDQEDDGDIQAVRFSRLEILTEKDFSECTDEELDELTRLMSTLQFSTYTRRSRRQVAAGRRGQHPDLRRTVQLALKNHGEPMQRAFTNPADKPRRLVLLLDVSGSMESYSRALIRFVHAAVVARNRVEAFAFGTRLTRVTRELSNRDPDAALRAATPHIEDWSGGTRLGDVMQEFNDRWGIRGMARGAVVVVLSDGWDRGDAALLGEQMERLHRVTHRLIWVNPLRASPGYEPLAAGMAAALPHVDDFVSGHAFSTMVDLAAILKGDR